MRIIHWNISYNSNKETIVKLLVEALIDGETVACLQEVRESTYEVITKALSSRFELVYSLRFRPPGRYDGRNRKLGVLIVCPKSMYVIDSGVIERSLFPDRTAYADVLYYGEIYRIISLHSITGVDYKKAKSTQYFSFAETIDAMKPDIVTVDANEPKVDHYDVSQMEFFDNRDKGAGAAAFFNSLSSAGLTDAFSVNYDRDQYTPGEPLTVSHLIHGKDRRRYDFTFINTSRLSLSNCEYFYEKGLELSSDHAIVISNVDPVYKSDNARMGLIENSFYPYNRLQEKHLLGYCRYYRGEEIPSNLIADYEKRWIDDIVNCSGKGIDYVSGRDLHELEIFNPCDGVPLGLKAILFNRFCHWSPYNTINDFKRWYLETYLSGQGG